MRRFRPRLVPTLVTLPVLAVLVSLGTWQVERLHWKTDLLQTMSERMEAAPVDLRDVDALDPAAAAWTRVRAEGRFVTPAGEVQRYGVENIGGTLGSRQLGVFETTEGTSLLVDRGFAAENTAPPPEPSGKVQLDAVLRDRSGEQQSWFVPDNDEIAGRWYWLDLAALEQVYGRPLAPLALQLLPGSPGATPQAAPPRIDLPNNHLGYAVTWYGLALGLVAVYLA
ncbi:MAG TPA: SURF1 family protein, partial [Geminicoccus sp.]|uniref:SURF1 family protein n=1 Tax=Geminicoccus sp. TaxID=2024832 RepID=UPI002E34E22E